MATVFSFFEKWMLLFCNEYVFLCVCVCFGSVLNFDFTVCSNYMTVTFEAVDFLDRYLKFWEITAIN